MIIADDTQIYDVVVITCYASDNGLKLNLAKS